MCSVVVRKYAPNKDEDDGVTADESKKTTVRAEEAGERSSESESEKKLARVWSTLSAVDVVVGSLG